MSYLETYKQHLQRIDDFKKDTLKSVVTAIKTISTKPFLIGNIWIYYVTVDGVDVPAFCFSKAYHKDADEDKFYPIYDEYGKGEHSWSDFKECCIIFDKIMRRLDTL